ncbi:EF-hand calcium-binding domain-containing protein 6 [Phytophthora citrophthora]|uniref:EF-hand calcium-binding domain-containing protein 6 n=1 Tax=Phytophthora citrophthora TaxID=4793 RepID=A0AAD9G969_9STRA|nr:EF-hand calcium-binding domain-containing protein 6 [Phytophthora citrophthora]
MQSNLAPAVTPRPVKPGAAAARSGRTYLLSASPIKLSSPDAKAQAVIRPAESPIPPSMRKKPLILSGDIRNLGSNFQLATSRETLSLTHLGDVFAAHGIVVTRAEAQALRHEFEENNDRGLSYVDFVDELARSLRGPTTGAPDTGCPIESSGLVAGAATRVQIKKPRLAEHLSRLSTRHTQLVGEVRTLLGANLRLSWAAVRDACRAAETGAGGTGKLPKATFARVLTGLQIPSLSPAAIEELSQDGTSIDYHEFLAQFGSSFKHRDTNNVWNSLVFDRPAGKAVAEVDIGTGANNITATNKTLQSPGVSSALGHFPTKSPTKASNKLTGTGKDPVVLEQLRIVVGNRMKPRSEEVLCALEGLDPSDSGLVPAAVFAQALRDFSLVDSEDDVATVLCALDGGNDTVDYRKFVSSFGDVTHPRGTAAMKRSLQENSSLVFTGNKDVKGAFKNRVALSSPGNELKEAFSRLPDASWRAIHVELELSDPRKGGLVPAAELLRVLSKHLGPLPSRHFGSLFRACGSHAHQLMDYRTLVKSYRPRVADTESFFAPPLQGEGARGALAVGRQHSQQATAPTESLVLVWSVRVARARLGAVEWRALQDRLASCDPRRQGRVSTPAFALAVREALSLTEAQVAFLCYFYEDRSIATDAPLIRYASFLTDYEDPGLEADDSNGSEKVTPRANNRVAGGGTTPSQGNPDLDLGVELEYLRQFFRANVVELEGKLVAEDVERRGFVTLPVFMRICAKLSSDTGSKWRETRATAKFLARYIARGGQFYYRGFLLDMDCKAGLQSQALVVQEDDEEDEERDDFDVSLSKEKALDAHEARAAIRHLLTVSRSQQSAVYKLLANMDPSSSGLVTYPELRRALERLGVNLRDDAVVQELFNFYEEEDARGDRTTGQVKYLQLLQALGGRDPDKVGKDSSMADLSSHCSYYSAVGISPRAVRRSQAGIVASRQLTGRAGHVLAAQAVTNSVENPRAALNAGVSSSGGAAAVEQKLQKALQAQGKTAWKNLARKLQALDTERRGSVTPSSLRKVLSELGIELDQEEIVRLQLKYDAEQNGRLNYHAMLRQLTSALSDIGSGSNGAGAGELLPSLTQASPRRNKPNGSDNVPEDLRVGVQAKWKEVYASLKTMDKSNCGRVSAAHFRQLLEWYALPITDTSFLAVLRAFDVDDGLVDYNRFMRACFRE